MQNFRPKWSCVVGGEMKALVSLKKCVPMGYPNDTIHQIMYFDYELLEDRLSSLCSKNCVQNASHRRILTAAFDDMVLS